MAPCMVSWMFVMRYCAAVLYMFVLQEEAERGPKASTGGMDYMYMYIDSWE